MKLQNQLQKKRKKSYPKVRIQVENGRFHIVGLNHWYSYWREPYRLLLTIPWIGFLFLRTDAEALAVGSGQEEE